MDIKTRLATAPDATAIGNVICRSITACCAEDHHNEPRRIEAWLHNKTPAQVAAWIANPSRFCVVAVLADEVVGFGMLEEDCIALCYVSPDIRFKGAGRVLLRAMERHAVQQGVTRLRLESTRTALAFYRRNGFMPTGPATSAFGMTGQPMSKEIEKEWSKRA